MLFLSLGAGALCILIALFVWVIPVSNGRTLREVLIIRKEMKKLRWDLILQMGRVSMESWVYTESGDAITSKDAYDGVSVFRDGDMYIKKTRLKLTRSQMKVVREIYDSIIKSCGHYEATEKELIEFVINRKGV